MNEEYTYDIGKYTIGIDNNGEDGIGLTVAIINDDGEIHLLGNCYGDNARCIDLLIKENQQLKEQLNKKYENVGTLTSEILYEENTKLVQENQQLKEQLEASEKTRKESMRILGEYRHYTLPTEEQNRENEDIVDKAYNNLI